MHREGGRREGETETKNSSRKRSHSDVLASKQAMTAADSGEDALVGSLDRQRLLLRSPGRPDVDKCIVEPKGGFMVSE